MDIPENSPPQVEVIISNSDGVENNGEQQSDNDAGSHNIGKEGLASVDGQVAVAAIEAERDVAIASIHAETEVARIEAQASSAEQIIEATTNQTEELEQCRNEIAELRERIDRLTEQLTPPQSPEVLEEMTENLETAPETSLTDQSTQTPEVSTETVLSDVNADLERTVERPIKRLIVI